MPLLECCLECLGALDALLDHLFQTGYAGLEFSRDSRRLLLEGEFGDSVKLNTIHHRPFVLARVPACREEKTYEARVLPNNACCLQRKALHGTTGVVECAFACDSEFSKADGKIRRPKYSCVKD